MKNLFIISAVLLLIFGCNSNDDTTGVTPTPIEDNPLTAVADAPLQWHYIAKDNMYARDGSTMGYLANLNNDSSKLIVYLVGGGACYNALTCANNPSNFDEESGQLASELLNAEPFGLNDRNDTNNMFADWNYIIIPYATGDVHSGTNQNADVPNDGPQNQKMTGYTNFTKVVEDLVGFYGENGITEFVVTGSSAGGFGTYLNFIQMAENFPNADMTGLVDAGPMFLDENVWNDCLGETWTNLWDFEFPADMDQVVQGTYAYDIQSIYAYLSRKYPSANFGLISDMQDSTIRYFYGFGQSGCTGQIGDVSGETFEQALLELQQSLTSYDNWNVYYVPDDGHTFLGSERFQTIEVNGVAMTDWIEDVTQGTANDIVPN